jgi:hypothetical protein
MAIMRLDDASRSSPRNPGEPSVPEPHCLLDGGVVDKAFPTAEAVMLLPRWCGRWPLPSDVKDAYSISCGLLRSSSTQHPYVRATCRETQAKGL